MPEDRAKPKPVQDARARPMRQDAEFRLKRARSDRPTGGNGRTPALLQGGGEALMFGDFRGPRPLNESKPQTNYQASRLGLAIIAVHQCAVPPADQGQELAEAAPSPANAPMPPIKSALMAIGLDR